MVLRVTIIGPGAQGVALAEELEARGAELRVMTRPGHKAAAAMVVRFEGHRGLRELSLAAANAAYLEATDIVFVTVKAFDLDAALSIGSQLKQGTVVIPVANGATWDIVRRAAANHPHCRWRLGFSTVAVSEVETGHYALRSKSGEVSFGPLQSGDEQTSVERELLTPAGFFAWHGNIDVLARRKWIYNTAINTLTAARRLPRNGDLLHDLATLAAVFNEALALATELWGPMPLDARTLYEGMIQLIEKTADNENSMARDRRLGKRTESDFMAGLAKDGRRYPLLTELHQEIGF